MAAAYRTLLALHSLQCEIRYNLLSVIYDLSPVRACRARCWNAYTGISLFRSRTMARIRYKLKPFRDVDIKHLLLVSIAAAHKDASVMVKQYGAAYNSWKRPQTARAYHNSTTNNSSRFSYTPRTTSEDTYRRQTR